MKPRPRLLLTIDFEDWHQLVHRNLGRDDWHRRHRAFAPQIRTLLDLLDEVGARATFFLLGMTVELYPELATEIVARGHDVGSHGFSHVHLFDQTREAFRDDVARSVEEISRTVGKRPTGYRAPYFSLNRRTPWAFDELAALGFRWDSSLHDSPRIPDRIGGIPAEPFRLRTATGDLWELPVAMRGPIPIGGGSYWRVLPFRLIAGGLHDDAVLYFHPYEFAPAPLRADLPDHATARQRVAAAGTFLWRNAARGAIVRRLRKIAGRFDLVSYDQLGEVVVRDYRASTRALSQAGVLL